MKKSLLLALLFSAGASAADKPLPESCQKFIQVSQEIAQALDASKPEEKKVIDELEHFSADFQKQWEELQAMSIGDKDSNADLQTAIEGMVDTVCSTGLQEFQRIIDEAAAQEK